MDTDAPKFVGTCPIAVTRGVHSTLRRTPQSAYPCQQLHLCPTTTTADTTTTTTPQPRQQPRRQQPLRRISVIEEEMVNETGSFEDYEGLLLLMRGRAVKLQFQSTALMSGLVALIYEGRELDRAASSPITGAVPRTDDLLRLCRLRAPTLEPTIFSVSLGKGHSFSGKPLEVAEGLLKALCITAHHYTRISNSLVEAYICWIGGLSPCWICWFVSMIFVCYIIDELMIELATATAQEADPGIRNKIQTAQVTVKGENLSALALGSKWLCTALSDDRSEGECSYIALSSSSLASVSFEFSSLSSSLSIAQLS